MSDSKHKQLVNETSWSNIQISDLLLGWSAPRLNFLKRIDSQVLLSNKKFIEYPYQVVKYYLKVVNYLATRLKFKTPRQENNLLIQSIAKDFTIISNDLNKNLSFAFLVEEKQNFIDLYCSLKKSWTERLDTNLSLINEILGNFDLGEWVDDEDNLMVIQKIVSDTEILSEQPKMDLSCIKFTNDGLIDHNSTDLLLVDNLAYEMLNYQRKWWDILSSTNNFEILRNSNTHPDSNDNNFLMYMCSICEIYGIYYWAITMYKKFATQLTINVSLAKSNDQQFQNFDKLATNFDIDQEALANLSVKYTSEFCYSQMKNFAELIEIIKPYLDI